MCVHQKYISGVHLLYLRFVLPSEGCLCKVSIHREGDNPNSIDGVPDLRDNNSFGVHLSLV